MSNKSKEEQDIRVLSGMRTTGAIHLGNYHGALSQWIELQEKYDCFFFAADFHALTTDYDRTECLSENTRFMLRDWLAAGLSPEKCSIFIQSHVKEHAELYLLLAMITPLGWLERVPTYKDTIQKLKDRDLSTYGFLGYPLLQSADILLYTPHFVPVGEDQASHIEMTREVARRVNHYFGRQFEGYFEKLMAVFEKTTLKDCKRLGKKYLEQGDDKFIRMLTSKLCDQISLTKEEKKHLRDYFLGKGYPLLREPEVILSQHAKVPGLDGQKMSKSYNNTIGLTENWDSVTTKVKKMQTDPQRVTRNAPGDPDKCPVYKLHLLYTDEKGLDWVQSGCRSASIGCLDCKEVCLDNLRTFLEPIHTRAQEIDERKGYIEEVIRDGALSARKRAQETLKELKEAIGFFND